jgi:hypothetical protein
VRSATAEILANLRNASRVPEMDEVGCSLPDGHCCTSGWHVRRDGGAGTAYERCPRALEEGAAKRAEEITGPVGPQTFENFEKFREIEAFSAATLWTECCLRSEPAKLALLRSEGATTNTGCGKSHLLRAAARELAKAGRWVEIVTAPALTAVVRKRALYDQAERGSAEVETKKWTSCEVLILDDLGVEETADLITASFLLGLFDGREGKPHALASNCTEQELQSRYGPALVSRLLGGAHLPALRGADYRRK